MSIRPIDMQVAVRGTQEVGAARQNVLNKQENQILNVQQQAVAERQHNANAVQGNIRTEEAEIRKKMKGEEQGKERGKEKERQARAAKQPEPEEVKEVKLPGEKGRVIDIKI